MPEARDRLPPGGGGRTSNAALGGFGLRPGFDTAAAAQPRSTRERNLGRSPPLPDNKENIPPGSSTSSSSRSRRRRTTRPRKTPLPSWYPRTPLGDITAVVNALERRRNRQRAAAELRRRTQERANSSPFPLSTTSPLAPEVNESEQAVTPIRNQGSLLSVSDLSPDPSASIQNSLQPAERPSASSRSIENSASPDKNTVEADKNSDSIDEIGRIVMENFQKIANRTNKKSKTSTLMSMR